MRNAIAQGTPVSDSTLRLFNAVCNDVGYTSLVTDLISAAALKKTATFSDAMATQISTKGRTLQIKDLIGSEPLLIDCWASWCKPCIGQMGYSKDIEKEYEGKVRFVYLSFDKNSSAGVAKASELKIADNNYLVERDFKSPFAAYFHITSIPRYIIIGKNGQVIVSDAPQPSQKGAVEKILDGLLGVTEKE